MTAAAVVDQTFVIVLRGLSKGRREKERKRISRAPRPCCFIHDVLR
jgi:hypothetical protein